MQISSVQVSGGGARQAAVSTDTPRTEAAALWLQYTAIDAAGNVGVGLRQVLVVCPGEEMVCFEDDSARPSACSVGGRCIDASLAGALGEQAMQGPALRLEPLSRPASVGICGTLLVCFTCMGRCHACARQRVCCAPRKPWHGDIAAPEVLDIPAAADAACHTSRSITFHGSFVIR